MGALCMLKAKLKQCIGHSPGPSSRIKCQLPGLIENASECRVEIDGKKCVVTLPTTGVTLKVKLAPRETHSSS